MVEFDIDFGKKLAETAQIVLKVEGNSQESIRTATYLSLLSAEISLKAMLEKAGIAPKTIRLRSHRLMSLVKDICNCEIEVEIAPGLRRFVSAARLCSIEITHQNAKTTVGNILGAEKKQGASIYPNEIRYGPRFRHFPPDALVAAAKAIANFATEHWSSIRPTMTP